MRHDAPLDAREAETTGPVARWARLGALGPGFVAMLTWLGAGDIVTAAVAGANYGYSLIWAMVLALLMRYLFVAAMARYQLCNPYGRSVLDGLAALHPAYPPFLLGAVVVTGVMANAYMLSGLGEISRELVGAGATALWSALWAGVTLSLVLQRAYRRIEQVFKLLLALLSLSLLGSALWVGPDPVGLVRSLVTLELPPRSGAYDSMFVAMSMVGAVGGSLTNLTYPYFLAERGWSTPGHLPLQRRDFRLAVLVMITLNLSVWTLGAELVRSTGTPISGLPELGALLAQVLGPAGRWLFYLGLFAAVLTSLVGLTLGFAHLGSHAWLRWRHGEAATRGDRRGHPAFRAVTLWLVLAPLAAALFGAADFVALTLFTSTVFVLLIPALAGGLWRLAASPLHIGPQHANRGWENLVMGGLFVLALWGAGQAAASIVTTVRSWGAG